MEEACLVEKRVVIVESGQGSQSVRDGHVGTAL